MAKNGAMQDLYDRLKKIGFDTDFLQRAVLPDWWEDSLATVPANRALAEMAIAQHLGLAIAQLRDPAGHLALTNIPNARLKKKKNTDASEVAGAIVVGKHAAELTARNLSAMPKFNGCFVASKVRKLILKTSGEVNLTSLVDFCWGHGIAVMHLKCLPKGTKKVDGMALFCGDVPCIVLASAKDSPPGWRFTWPMNWGISCLGM